MKLGIIGAIRVAARRIRRRTEPISLTRAVDMTLAPIAVGQILASLEAITVGSLYHRDGLLRGVAARNAPPGTLRRRLALVLDAPVTPKVLAGITMAAAIALLCVRGRRRPQAALAAVIAACNRLSEIRTPYGRDGADQMTSVVSEYRALSALVPESARSDELFLRAVNLQAAFSYLISGVSKLFGSSWVQGDALGEVLQSQTYGGGPLAPLLKDHPRLNRVLTWFTPLWETAFPVIYLLPPRAGRFALAAVKGFHISVAAVMELPRFVWGFSGAHGAVRYLVDLPLAHRKRASAIELSVVGAAAGLTALSGAHAVSRRQRDVARRRGLRGTQLLDLGDGVVEYAASVPTDSTQDGSCAPIVILEAGLGNALEAWAWVIEELSDKYHVIAYHRTGYGLTTTRARPTHIVEALVKAVGSTGPLIAVSHSMGLLQAAKYVADDVSGRRVSAVVVVDGTDPDLLSSDRKDRRRSGSFLQSQAHSMFASLTGIYNLVPHALARQSAYTPDDQEGVIQFAYSPRHLLRATIEYFSLPVYDVLGRLREAPVRYVLSSQENAAQQLALAEKLGARYVLIHGSSHRSILGYRAYASRVAAAVREAAHVA